MVPVVKFRERWLSRSSIPTNTGSTRPLRFRPDLCARRSRSPGRRGPGRRRPRPSPGTPHAAPVPASGLPGPPQRAARFHSAPRPDVPALNPGGCAHTRARTDARPRGHRSAPRAPRASPQAGPQPRAPGVGMGAPPLPRPRPRPADLPGRPARPPPYSPSILLSSALCRSGFCTARRFLSSLAHTMKAFMGRRMRLSEPLSPGWRGAAGGDSPSDSSASRAGHSSPSGHG
ncbi:hypothetical protein VULLAG_LOCUS23242 [Vulpes lagopus]